MSHAQQSGSFSMGDFCWWIGVVESRNDPEKVGRVKVRIYGLHSDDLSNTKTDDLYWATVMMPVTSPFYSGKGHSPTRFN